jgi:hypothetical protein
MPSAADLQDPKEYQKIFHWAETQKDATIPSFNTRKNDPYKVCLPDTTKSIKKNKLMLTVISTKKDSEISM